MGPATGTLFGGWGKMEILRLTLRNRNPWFSYQHNVHYVDEKTLLLFDNGNSRCFGVKNCHSRGQIWTIDEKI